MRQVLENEHKRVHTEARKYSCETGLCISANLHLWLWLKSYGRKFNGSKDYG